MFHPQRVELLGKPAQHVRLIVAGVQPEGLPGGLNPVPVLGSDL